MTELAQLGHRLVDDPPITRTPRTELERRWRRRRSRRLRVATLTIVVAGGAAVAGLLGSGARTTQVRVVAPPAPRGGSTGSTTSPSSPAPPTSGPALLRGDGVDTVTFGVGQATAVADLDKVLGPPTTQTPNTGTPNCDVDATVQWPMVTAFFFKGRFVGYSTLAANGESLPRANLATAAGLRVGDSLDRARQLYGQALTTSLAQGGAWFVHTSTGTLEGFLTAEPNQTRSVPRIASIEAGSVGCPAATP